MKISIEVDVKAPLEKVWETWVSPEHIINWNFASDDWCCPAAKIDLKVGGEFSYRMEAKDGSMGFDCEGTFIKVAPYHSIHFKLEDDRIVKVEFSEMNGKVKVVEIFEAEDENSAEQQKQGWQSILNNFKKHAES